MNCSICFLRPTWRLALHRTCHHTEFFLVCIFSYSVRIQENTDQKKLHIWTLFTQCLFQWILLILIWLLFGLLISTLLFACYIFWVRREFILRKVSDNNVIFSYDWALLHLTQFHAYYSLILLLFWRIVLSNIILIFFLEYLLLCYILVYREY